MDDSIHFTRAPKMGTGVNGTYLVNARPPTHTRPQTRERQGAWSVDAGRGQRGVQSDVRRDGGGRRSDQLRREARERRARGRRRTGSSGRRRGKDRLKC